MENNLNFLSTRGGFNTALRQFKIVNAFIKSCQSQSNLADLINDSINQGILKQFQIKSILNVILIDKFNYTTKSINLHSVTEEDYKKISEEVSKWNIFDLILAYYHPQLGLLLINPKSAESWEALSNGLKENELAVIYAGNYGKEFDTKLAKKAAETLTNLLEGKKISDTKQFTDDSLSFQSASSKPSQKQTPTANKPKPKATPGVKKKLSPQYGIVVQNELFHNGNVEAWKKIIESYENKYPNIEVLVFYDNEQIHDLNTLFKWGKVKHGTMIFFSLLGPEFKNVSKLRRYLAQGASPRFEAFLKGSPGQILPLF